MASNTSYYFKNKKLAKVCLFCFGSILFLISIIVLFYLEIIPTIGSSSHKTIKIPDIYYFNYDVSKLDDSEGNKLIKYGYKLFNHTPKYIGPDNGNEDMAYQGNRLACKNCHLNSGTKPFSAPLIGIIQRFPQFRGRENKIGTIQDRINGCMERSMNGKMLPGNSKEMQAIVKYLDWLSQYAPKDGMIEGLGFVEIKLPNRAVNLENGEQVFQKNCIICHQSNGLGLLSANGMTYDYPPLWGSNSYNDGAGMARVITAAQFIKANMPFGTSFDTPVLTDEEAYDVAGYINTQNRPSKDNKELDFPDRKKKPVSTPYGPYADNFSVEQHQKGPFQPIIEFYKKEYNITKSK